MAVKIEGASRLAKALEGTSRQLKKELQIAINATAAKSKSIINKEIRSELALPAKSVNSLISVSRKATADQLGATVRVKRSKRPNLNEFSNRQTKVGVSAKISKTKPRTVVPGAFKVDKWGGAVAVRRTKTRLPIRKPRGPSPVGVLLKGKKLDPAREQTKAELQKQIDRRIRFINLKKAGTI